MSARRRLAHRRKTVLRWLLGVFAVYWSLTVYLAAKGKLSQPTRWGDITMLALMCVITALFAWLVILRRQVKRDEKADKEKDETEGG